MKLLLVFYSLIATFISKVRQAALIIAPARFPFLYRLTMMALFLYVLFGIINLAYKDMVLIDTVRLLDEAGRMRAQSSAVSTDITVFSDPVLRDHYYRQVFGLVSHDEVLLDIHD